MLVAMLGDTTRADVLQSNPGGFKGAIFANLMADTHQKVTKPFLLRFSFLSIT